MTARCSRRDFLKLSASSLAAFGLPIHGVRWYPVGCGRVAATLINIYETPSFSAKRRGKLYRDQLVTILREINSSEKSTASPLWYQINSGYVHSAYIQRVDSRISNPLVETIPDLGLLFEVTVPYTQSVRFLRQDGWQDLYRLYYGSIHWITGIDSGPDGNAWYRIHDLNLNAEYFARAGHLRPIYPQEYSPVSTDIPPAEKHIEVDIASQMLTAFEGDQRVYETSISSGVYSSLPPVNGIPTETPLGSFHIQLKMPSSHMGDRRLTSDPEAYELPGVPWTCIFHNDGIALHGTYWHNHFGHRMSHGCVNLRNPDALWLFRWTDPVFTGDQHFQQGSGTLVIIR